jgi:NAD(P)-dependent dehydrogenase (short-subunit alcohol dehydrogenase family)
MVEVNMHTFPKTLNTLITGAGSGIGRAIALAMAANGARVMVTDKNADWAAAVANEITQAGGEALSTSVDVTQPEQAQAALTTLLSTWGRLDVWINNAGVSSMNRFVDLTEQDWDFNMDINAKGAFLCSQVAARQLIAQEPDPERGLRGKIINIASMAGKRGNAPFLAHYVASKFAVVGLTQSMAGELAPYGITVNSVCPGYVATSMQERELGWEASLRGATIDEVKRLYIADTPLARIQTAEDVASIVVFLASPLSDFMTGEALNINGGSFMD